MPWEDLAFTRTSARSKLRDKFAISISKHGKICIWIPRDHKICDWSGVATQVGTKEHEGWLRISEDSLGRKVSAINKTANAPRFIRYSTLPGAPEILSAREIHAEPEFDQIHLGKLKYIKLKLPWAKEEQKYTSIMSRPLSQPPQKSSRQLIGT